MAYVALSQKMWRPMNWIEPGFLKRGPRPPLGANGMILWGPRLEAFTR